MSMASLPEKSSEPVTTDSQEAYFSAAFLLLDAHHMALARRRPVADFAVPVQDLHRIGLTDHQLRHLALEGLVKLEVNQARRSRTPRQFRRLTEVPSASSAAIFCVPTPRGVLWARQCLSQASIPYVATNMPTQEADAPALSWIPDQYELRQQGNAVLVYDKLAPNPFRLFGEFEKQHWRSTIDNPFAPDDERLRNTVKKINARLKGRPLYFVVRSGGRKAGWKMRETRAPDQHPIGPRRYQPE
jgi:hypothetical protein